ncbi:autotransporter domain-containing protein [Herbaspirillum seropedicae]|uniref:autotransporter family protein n=1 Tax=Herbaspirillum seropedicae TaxID=964 RepID=UPI0015DEB0FD|nr:autotransporter domain-containing protein [Herbaspirillum seropedicae]
MAFLLLGVVSAARAQTVTALPDALVGVPYSATFTPNCGGCPQTIYSYDNWDSALSLNMGAGLFDIVVSGTPTVAGTSSVTLTYFDAKRNLIGSAKWTMTAVALAPTSISLGSSSTSPAYGAAVTLTANLAGTYASSGTVSFKEGGVTLGTVAISSYAASLTINTLAPGSHSLTAVFDGDATTSAPLTVTVAAATPALSLASSASVLNEHAPLTLTATLAGGVSPAGTVSFMDGAAILDTISLSGQSASLTLNTLAVGSHSLSAVYNGDSNNNSTSSASVAVAVAGIHPAVVSVAPASGSVLGNTRVSISGARLAGATSVSFGASVARIVSNSDTELVVVTSAHMAGTVDLVVIAAGGTVTVAGGYSYAALPDPASSAAVTAMVRAQTQAVQRFATAHLANFTQRLEALHGEGGAPSSFGLSFGQTNDPRREPTTWARGGDIVNYRDSELAYLRAGLRNTALAASSTASTASTVSASGPDDQLPELPQVSETASRGDIAWWISGALDLLNQKDSAGQSSARLATSGVSVGGDYRISRTLTLGMGAGYSLSTYRADDDSASSRGQGVMGVLYASTRPVDDLYVDVLAGYGVLRFDLSRFIADTGVLAAGSRTGRQVFASTTVGYEWRGQGWLVSPYVRLDLARATLERYTESGGAGALSYFSQPVGLYGR